MFNKKESFSNYAYFKNGDEIKDFKTGMEIIEGRLEEINKISESTESSDLKNALNLSITNAINDLKALQIFNEETELVSKKIEQLDKKLKRINN